jgi:hypothetical protein
LTTARTHTHTHTHTRLSRLLGSQSSAWQASRFERGRNRRTEVVPHTGCKRQVPGTQYVPSLCIAQQVEDTGTSPPPKEHSEPSQSAVSKTLFCPAARQHRPASVNRDCNCNCNCDRARARTSARNCDLDCDLNRKIKSWLLTGAAETHSTVWSTASWHGIDTATSTAWIHIPQANHARHRGQDRQRGNATLVPCASNATGHFPACCSSCHVI